LRDIEEERRMAQIVAISGAAGGLGPTVARAFLEAGASLAVAGRDESRLVRMLDTIGAPPDRRLATAADLSDPEAAAAWAGAVTARFGKVDVLLHLVGGYAGGGALSDLKAADWQMLHTMLVLTTFAVVRAFAGPLKSAGSGRFIGVTSPKAQAPTARSALYAMAKAASDALVLSLADELRGSGATANLVVVDSIEEPPKAGTGTRAPYGKSTPAGEIAAAMLFLCSPQAATINGVRLPLTGRG
jgi:NAD(P)-dependent dehydrogenase (short-subunit alcohol dehydrogenase family)